MMPTPVQDPLSVLKNPSSTLGQVQCALPELERQALRKARIAVSSNVIVDLLEVFLRRHAVLQGVHLEVATGNYDDPVGDVERFLADDIEQLVILPFFDNLMPAFEARAAGLSTEGLDAKEADLRARYGIMFRKAAAFKRVFLGSFHRFTPSAEPGGDAVDPIIARFNRALKEEASAFENIRWIDTESILRRVGQAHAFDPRFYFKAKAPFTTAFLNLLAQCISVCSRGFGSHFSKVLVLDCDNTLWGGVVGEDLLEGIKLDPYEYPGNVFWRIQNELVFLEQNGVLICLCSKNNPADVEEVLSRHPHAVLKTDHLVLQKVNWNDKVSSLREIAGELNLGLDSLVFLDDSQFECESVRKQLPMVRTYQVPARLTDYPALVQEIKELFLGGGVSSESRSKTQQYRSRARAIDEESGFATKEDYLLSLGLKVAVTRDRRESMPRISELTLKSNQFNLTTRRYTEGDIQKFMENPETTVYSLAVSDRFGDSGLTGILIMRWEGTVARVDSFLMSCRVIGRGIEKAIWGCVQEDALDHGCVDLCAEFIPSPKNSQVAAFFDELGLTLLEETPDGIRRYRNPIKSFTPPTPVWIEVVSDR